MGNRRGEAFGGSGSSHSANPAVPVVSPPIGDSNVIVSRGRVGQPWTSDIQTARESARLDKILNGATAGDPPVERPTRLELVINRKTAKADRPDDSAECAGASG